MSRSSSTVPGAGPQEVRMPVPLLFGGVSQQPPPIRAANQVSAATNFDFSVYEGLTKRPGTEFVRVVAAGSPALVPGGDYRMTVINRDENEAYFLIRGDTATNLVVRALEVDGPEATITPGSGAQAYLDGGGAAASDVRPSTIADYTVIVNSKVATGVLASAAYSVTGTWKDYDVMAAHTPAQDTYHRAQANGAVLPLGYYKYNSGSALLFATYKGKSVSGSTYGSPTGAYDDSANNPGGFRIAFQRVPNTSASCTIAASGSDFTITKVGGFTSYTFVSGDMVRIASGTGCTAGWATIASRDSNDQITVTPTTAVLVPCINAVLDGIGQEYEVTVNLDAAVIGVLADMDEVAKKFQAALRGAGCEDGLIGWTQTGPAAGYFSVTSPYKGNDARAYVTTSPSSGYDYTLTGRPFSKVGAEYTLTAGSGGAGSATFPVDSRWTPVAAPSQAGARLDPAKLPLALVRTAFTGDGSTPATFTLNQIVWNDRTSGDNTTNPPPSLFSDGIAIADAGFYKNRLVFAGGERIVTSQDGDLFNFYQEDDTNLVDSDPVQRTLSSPRVTVVSYLLPYRTSLLIFTRAGQSFELSSDGALTPASASLVPSTNYPARDARPRGMEGRVYFATASGGPFSQLQEYVYDDLQASSVAVDITAAVPAYLPESVRTVEPVDGAGVVVVLPADGLSLYVYRSLYTGNRKEQSAWTRYTFDASYRICDIAALRGALYLLVESAGQFIIEQLCPAPGAASSGSPWPIRLDRRVSLTGVHAAGTTTWTLPFSDTTIDRAIKPDGTTLTLARPTATTATAAGDHSASACVLGRTFTASAELTRPYLRDGQQALPDQGLRVRSSLWLHRNTGAYTVTLTGAPWPVFTQSFAAPAMTVEESGFLLAFTRYNPDTALLSVTSNDPRPCTIVGLVYTADLSILPR